jgi:tetratricopeptide (TPR) repeat protein
MANQPEAAPAPAPLSLDERYSQERWNKFLNGEMTGAEFHEVSPPQMLKMAILGFQQYEQGRYPEAQAVFERLLRLNPREPYYHIAIGAVFLAQDDLPRAELGFNRAIKLGSKDVAAFVNRGEVLLRRGKIPQAADDFKKAVALDPKGEDPLTVRARLLAKATAEMLQKAQAAKDGQPASKAGAAKPSAPAAKPTAKASAAPAKKK